MQEDNGKYEQLRRGLLELAVLKVISRHKVYAGDILDALSVSEFATGEGTLYPMLSRMHRTGMVDYEWAESESGPPRKYYSLAPSGIKQLEDYEAYLKTINHTIKHLGERL